MGRGSVLLVHIITHPSTPPYSALARLFGLSRAVRLCVLTYGVNNMFNAWTVFWSTFSRIFTVIDNVGETAQVASAQGLAEVKGWAELNDASRLVRINKARKAAKLPELEAQAS